MTGESVDVKALLAEARKALRCLYIAVDERIARDVSAKVEAALAAATARAEAAEAGEAALRAALEALCGSWTQATCQTDGAPCSWHRVSAECATDLRALLATGGAE